MAADPVQRIISDDLLGVAVRIKRDAGVSHAQVQAVIDQFASDVQWQERTGGIGYPLVEDIPQHRRGGFLAALAELAPGPAPSQSAKPRWLSAAKIWPERIFKS